MTERFVVENPTEPEVRYVLENLRPEAREEIVLQSDEKIETMALRMAWAPGFSWAVYYDGRPAALIGANPMHPGVWSLYGTGTSDWPKVGRLVTLVAKRDMMRAVKDAGAHRAQCLSPAWHHETHKWLRWLGATEETALPAWGRNGEDFIMFTWLKDRA